MYANLESFSNQCSYYVSNFSFFKSSLPLLSFFIYIKNLFVVTIFFPFYLIKHRPRKVYLKAPRGRSNIRRTQRSPWHLGNRRAFGHLRHSGNRAFRGTQGTWELGHSDNQDIQAFRESGHLDTQSFENLYLAGSAFKRQISFQIFVRAHLQYDTFALLGHTSIGIAHNMA